MSYFYPVVDGSRTLPVPEDVSGPSVFHRPCPDDHLASNDWFEVVYFSLWCNNCFLKVLPQKSSFLSLLPSCLSSALWHSVLNSPVWRRHPTAADGNIGVVSTMSQHFDNTVTAGFNLFRVVPLFLWGKRVWSCGAFHPSTDRTPSACFQAVAKDVRDPSPLRSEKVNQR